MTIALVLADDHGVVRAGLRLLLETQSDFKVVGEATNGREALQVVAKLRPQVAVVDIAMPEQNGIEATRQISADYPETQVIILSMYANLEYVQRALRAGARGYVLKESAGDELIEAVRAVHAGRRHLGLKIVDEFVDDYLAQRTPMEQESPLEQLSAREREVLQLVAEGKSSPQIAERLALSPKTVDTYRSRLMQKLEIDDLPKLVLFALRHGIIAAE
jgi:DNA-binding NarL/FixJ family response regulator